MKHIKIIFILVLLCVAFEAYAQSERSDLPAVVYSRHGVLYITTASGRVLRTVKSTVPIGDFAITADASKVVFTPLNAKKHGAQLYLLTTHTGKVERLTHGPYFDPKGRSEVYSDPDLSPSGHEAVFAIHAQSTGDIVEASGPFAKVNLATKQVRVLQSTLQVDVNGVAYANEPHWAPDGMRILLNYEDGADLTNAIGKTNEDLSSLMSNDEWTHALGWLGPQCIVFVAGKDYKDAGEQPARVLNLTTHKTGSFSELLGVPKEQVTGLMTFSSLIRVRKDGQQLIVEGTEPPWKVPYEERDTFVRVLPTQQATGRVPASCK